jgi:hypothetical protein
MIRRLLFAALLALLCASQPASAAYLPGCMQLPAFTIDYTDNMFKVASPTTTKTLTTLASLRVQVCKTVDEVRTGFTWAGTDAGTPTIVCSLGSATTSPEDHSAMYSLALDWSQTARRVSIGGARNGKDVTTYDSNLAVVLTCKSNSNFGTGSATYLTGGKAWINVSTETLKPGS